MSADNWAVCPKCNAGKLQKLHKMTQEVANSYGKVDANTYQEKLLKLSKLSSEKDQEYTLREDYEIGVRGNKFSVDYIASCDECGFELPFKFEQDLPL